MSVIDPGLTPLPATFFPPLAVSPRQRSGPLRVIDAVDLPRALKGAVLLLGNFDGFHRGHQALLEKARVWAGGGRPLALMSCEPHPRSFFSGGETEFRLTTPEIKLETFARFGFDYVYAPRFDAAFAGQSPETFIREVLAAGLAVSHVVAGDDFRFGRKRAGDVRMLREAGERHGFGVSSVGVVTRNDARCSSSLVRDLIAAGDIEGANDILGYPWVLPVQLGDRGEVRLDPRLLRPPVGRYHGLLTQPGGEEVSSVVLHVESATATRFETKALRTLLSPASGALRHLHLLSRLS
jgi:riboflavin kinase/FMN adenylyltransferase